MGRMETGETVSAGLDCEYHCFVSSLAVSPDVSRRARLLGKTGTQSRRSADPDGKAVKALSLCLDLAPVQKAGCDTQGDVGGKDRALWTAGHPVHQSVNFRLRKKP